MRRMSAVCTFLVATLFTGLAVAETYQTKLLAADGIHDPDNEAVKNILQEPAEAMVDFPLDRLGLIDWVKAINDGLVNPRKSLAPEGDADDEMPELDMDIIMKQTSFMPNVRFPHLAHTKWLSCDNCHPGIFEPQLEANPVSMEKILKGEYCGRCHDKVSFPIFFCERCHSVPHDNSAPAFVEK